MDGQLTQSPLVLVCSNWIDKAVAILIFDQSVVYGVFIKCEQWSHFFIHSNTNIYYHIYDIVAAHIMHGSQV